MLFLICSFFRTSLLAASNPKIQRRSNEVYMKILVISSKNKNLFNFRGDLIKDMICHGHEVYATGPNKTHIEDVMAVGIKRFYEIPSVRDNTSIVNDVKYLFQLKKTIREIRPDLVFSFNIKPIVYGSIAARMEKVPHIYAMVTGLGRVYSSGGLKTSIIRFITNLLYRIALRCCNQVIFQNHEDIDDLVRAGCLPRWKARIVNGSGVNMNRFIKTEFPETPVFLMVSRIIREKGVLEYCDAARKLKQDHPEARCVLLGGYDASIGALAKHDLQEYLEDGSIELVGEVKDPVAFYGLSSVFVLPSYYREGLPRTILEAMSCGRPVITTDWVGCREPIQDGVNGYLVPIKDSAALAQKMAVLCDMHAAQSMGDAGYQICREKYEVSIINQQMREILEY